VGTTPQKQIAQSCSINVYVPDGKAIYLEGHCVTFPPLTYQYWLHPGHIESLEDE